MADRTRMRRFHLRSLISVLAVSLVLTACGGDDSGSGNGNGQGEAGDAPQSEAQAIFVEVGCAECHGEQGEGVEGVASSLQGTRTIILAFETRVRNGRGQAMPGYSEEQISDEEIALVHEWLQNQ